MPETVAVIIAFVLFGILTGVAHEVTGTPFTVKKPRTETRATVQARRVVHYGPAAR